VIGVGVIERVRIYLEDAWEFYRRGREELLRGLEKGYVYEVRDGAEKLWNAVVQATNALILHLLGLVPASHWEWRRKLMELEGRFEEVGKLGLCDRYCARERHLRGMTFYEGIVDEDLLRYEVQKVERYLRDVEDLIRRLR